MAKRKAPSPRRRAVSTLSGVIEIDFVILGDFAQAAVGKLNLIGGGWNVLHAKQYPFGLPFGIGIGILVPWHLTNRKHDFTFVIKASEGRELVKGGGEFEVGREAGMPAGMTQRFTLGISGHIQIPQAATYEIIVTTADAEKRVTFEALPPPITG